MHTWPLLRNLPITAIFAPTSGSASGKTMNGAWPPSSRLSALDLVGGAAHQLLADLGRAGEADLADRSGFPGTRRPISWAGPMTRLATPGRQPGLDQALEDLDQAQRRLAGGLADDGAAGGQGRRDLARLQRDREVPRADGADDADRVLDRDVPLARRASWE